jgi:23S rRNA pseudouridine2605 synthase
MREGRKRQIREIGKGIGLPVVRILRVRIGTLRLGVLKPREWRNLTEEEVNTLRSLQEQSTARKNHLPGRTMDESSERNASRKRRPFSPHKPSSSGVRKPSAPTRRRNEHSSGVPFSAKPAESGSDWKSRSTQEGTGKPVKRDSGPTGNRDRFGNKTARTPGPTPGSRTGAGTGRSPSSRPGSRPPGRSPRKPDRKP